MNKLLSSLRLKLDGSSAAFLGNPLGPAEWYNVVSEQLGRKRGLEWLARGVDAKDGVIEVNGQTRQAAKIDATVSCGYHEKDKRTVMNMSIWQTGANPSSGEFLFLAVKSMPSTASP